MNLQRRDILDIRIISWLYRRSIRRRREKAGLAAYDGDNAEHESGGPGIEFLFVVHFHL